MVSKHIYKLAISALPKPFWLIPKIVWDFGGFLQFMLPKSKIQLARCLFLEMK
jgi:hypothetical protein